jgi:hypothetical protein
MKNSSRVLALLAVTHVQSIWYSESRMHSTLRYVSPGQFEQQAIASPIALAA